MKHEQVIETLKANGLHAEAAYLEVVVNALKKFVNEADEHDFGGGDLVVTTCESLEAAESAISGK